MAAGGLSISNNRNDTSISASGAVVSVWDGSTDGDWSDSNNWSNTVPGQSSTAIFSETGVDVDEALDQNTVTLRRLVIGEGYTGEIGTTSTPLRISADHLSIKKLSGRVNLRGSYLEAYIDGCDGRNGGVRFANTSGDVITSLYVLNSIGEISIEGGTVTNLYITPRTNGIVKLSISAGATVTTVRTYGTSQINSASNIATLVAGKDSVVTMTGAAANTTVKIVGRGLVRHHASGATGTLTVYPNGRVEAGEDNKSSTLAVTGLTVHRDGVADFSTGNRIAAFGAAIAAEGGLILLDPGATMAVA
jgi:hypothetical protein